jgi:hypothetical protein
MRLPVAIAFVFAFVAGFGLGRWAARPLEERAAFPTEAASTSSRAGVAQASVKPREDWRAAEGKLLAAVQSGSKDDLVTVLLATLSDDRTPPLLRELRVETLARRIVQLGGAEELLTLFGLRAEDREQVAAAAIRALTETEPATAERLVAAMPAGSRRTLATQALLEALATKSPKRGLALLEADKDSRQGGYRFFSAWAKKDPKAAAEAALALQKEYDGYGLGAALEQWARSDSDAAIQWSEQLQGEQRKRAVSQCVFGLGAVDPVAAAMFLIGHPDEAANYVAHDMLNSLEGDPRRVAEEVLAKVPPGDVRTSMLEAIAQSLATDPAQALDWAGTLLPGERDRVVHSIFYMAGQAQPEEAFHLALDKLEGETRRTALHSMLENWAEMDFDAAFRAATETLDASELKDVLPGMFRGSQFLLSDPAQRLRMLSKLDPRLRSDLLKAIGRNQGVSLYRSGLQKTLDSADRNDLLEGMIARVSDNPALTREIASQLPEDRKQAQVEAITRSLAYEDPRSAAEFALSVTGHDKQKSRALEELAGDWAYTDPAAAEAFVYRLPPDDIRKTVARRLAERFRTFDPDAAKRMEAQLGTP